MALAEDAATVLEQFVQDAANLPAEIAHLLEEIEAKEKVTSECRSVIGARDSSIQKFIRINGSGVPNPKEEAYTKTVLANYDRAEKVQDEKILLAESAAKVLDRQIRRLDAKIRDLQVEGTMPSEPPLPSLLHPSSANRTSLANTPTTGASTPLTSISTNAVPSTTIANSDITRLAHPTPSGQRSGSPNILPGPQPHRTLPNATQLSNSAPTTPAATAILQQRQRESSAGAINDAKRRRLNAHLTNMPATSSGLARPSSLGPGPPKAGTPGAVRAGSAGPRTAIKKKNTKVAPHQQMRKKFTKAGLQKKASKKSAGGIKASPSSSDDDQSMLSEATSADEAGRTPPPGGANAPEDFVMGNEPDDDDPSDDRKYCTCHNVSYGNMVACDNDDCPYEWFHWQCVGVTKEPAGAWYCEECRKNGHVA